LIKQKSTDNKAEANAQITKMSRTTKVKQFFWIFVVFKVFPQSSKWVPNSISLCEFFQCCPIGSYIGELIFQLIHLYFWSEYFLYVEISKAFELFICDGPIRPLNEMLEWNLKQK
jgi:hypothetical protein